MRTLAVVSSADWPTSTRSSSSDRSTLVATYSPSATADAAGGLWVGPAGVEAGDLDGAGDGRCRHVRVREAGPVFCRQVERWFRPVVIKLFRAARLVVSASSASVAAGVAAVTSGLGIHRKISCGSPIEVATLFEIRNGSLWQHLATVMQFQYPS